MKKIYLLVTLLLCLNMAFAQWTKINAIPSTDITVLTANGNTIYAATRKNTIYKSTDGGTVWIPLTFGPDTMHIGALQFYHNTLYVGTFTHGVFFSTDNGATWQNNGTGPNDVSSFTIKNDILYASTFGDGAAVMNAANNTWSFLNNALPSYSTVAQSIISSPNFLLMAAGSNGTFYRYNFNNNTWNEEYYDGILHPALHIDNFINSGDTLFAVNSNRIITSINAGATWVNDKLNTHNGFYRNIYEGTTNYYSITYVNEAGVIPEGTWIQQRNKNAAVGSSWSINEEFLADGLSYAIIEFNNKLFLAKSDGLYFKNLQPVILPVHFVSLNTTCDKNKVTLNWKTAQEQNSNRFDIERSTDGIHWIVIGNLPAAGNSTGEKNYSFTDSNPVSNGYYRIAEHDANGSVQYSDTTHSSCSITDTFAMWPNPVHHTSFINITTGEQSLATIKIFDSKGALMAIKKEVLSQGNNLLSIDMRAFANGVYHVAIDWNNGLMKRIVKVFKQ